MPNNKWDLKKGSTCCAVEYTNAPFSTKITNDVVTAIEEGTDYKGGGVDFDTFKKENPNAKGLNHLSKYLK